MTPMTMQQSLLNSMHLPEESVRRIQEHNVAIADVDTMSQAIHDVYCGILADHEHPNEKDRQQAQQMIDALQKAAAAPAG
jgi:hypothetical protein